MAAQETIGKTSYIKPCKQASAALLAEPLSSKVSVSAPLDGEAGTDTATEGFCNCFVATNTATAAAATAPAAAATTQPADDISDHLAQNICTYLHLSYLVLVIFSVHTSLTKRHNLTKQLPIRRQNRHTMSHEGVQMTMFRRGKHFTPKMYFETMYK